MSKQGNKAKSPGPYDPPPKTDRKVSNKGSPKFYDGPTVAAKANEVKEKASKAAVVTATEAKRQGKKAVAKARRHPWSIISILTTIPFLITMSLFSTVVCPPPKSTLSPVSKFVLSPLGLHDHSGQHSKLHRTLCYPANVYHQEFLEPYVNPIVDDVQRRAYAHPIYVKGVQPAVKAGKQAWDGPIKPIVERTQRGARGIYLTFIQPHLPFLKAKYTTLTAPYTSRVSAFYAQNVAPHLSTANQYTQHAGKRSIETYNYVASHPLTGQAGKYANQGYKFSKVKGQQAYKYARPHAIRAGKEAERIAREILGPRAIQGLKWTGVRLEQGYAVAKSHAVRLYYKHLDPYIGEHVARAKVVALPYVQLFQEKVYHPYIYPLLESILPEAVLAPEPPKSFWALIADFLPGSHVAERKVDMREYKEKIKEARKPAKVPVPGSEKIVKAESAKDGSKVAKQFDREEMKRVRDAIKDRVEQQGKKGYQTVRKELLDYNTHILADEDKFPALMRTARSEVEREFEYITSGLDKLYTVSTTLTKEQIDKSSMQAETRVSKKVQQLKDRGQKLKNAWHEGSRPIIKRACDDLDAALGNEWADLRVKMTAMEDVNAKVRMARCIGNRADKKDWADYNRLKDIADEWTVKYTALHNGETKDRALTAPSASINKAISSWSSDLTDLFENWRDSIRQLRKTAYQRVEAREALAAESSSTTTARIQTAGSADPSRVSILPVVGAGVAAAAANGIIGKGKEQILDALSQASSVAAGTQTPTGVADQAMSAANSAYSAASSAAHDATRTIISAMGATPSPEALSEHAESIIAAAGENVQSAYGAASSVVHDATRSVISAVGGTPSPESIPEHAQSVIAVASDNAQAGYQAASSVVHEATRSIISAVGATPSPEGVSEHLESLADVVKVGYASIAAHLGENVQQATRAGMDAINAIPTPRHIAEQDESLALELSASVSSVASEASAAAASYASVAGSAVHDGTRSVGKAIGVTPTPESPAEYAESLASVASASIESAAMAASSAVHEATRSAIVAVGGTPSPESPAEHAQSIANVASSAAASAYDQAMASAASAYTVAVSNAGAAGSAVTDQAVLLGQQIQEALGLVSTPEPYASSASAYLASVTDAAGTGLPDLLESGKSLLASIQGEAAQTLHQATRAASRAVGATPTPETAGEYVEAAQEKVKSVVNDASAVVEGYASSVSAEAERVTESVKRAVGRDEL